MPKALTSATVAFEAGFRARLRGDSILHSNYASPLMTAAYERGWRKADELKKKEK